MKPLRVGIIGCGFFAQFHRNAWREIPGVEIAAVCDLDGPKAEAFAAEAPGAAVFTDAERMIAGAGLDFVDIVTHPSTHRALVELAARRRMNAICQKPLAFDLDDVRAMVAAVEAAGIRFMAHENFRWQTPMRAVKRAAAEIGELFYGRIHFRCAFDVFANQPYLAEDERFVIADLGVHLVDLSRFFMGETRRLYCHSQRLNPDIRGEDVATIMLELVNGGVCLVELSYGSHLEEELFPQTLVHLEGREGSVTLGADYQLTTVTPAGVRREAAPPRRFSWSDDLLVAIQDSVVACEQHWVDCYRANQPVESTAADNLRTLQLVDAAYRSAEAHAPVELP